MSASISHASSLPLDREGEWWVDEIGGVHAADGVDASFDSLFFQHLGQLKVIVKSDEIVLAWDVGNVASDALSTISATIAMYAKAFRIRLRYRFYGWMEEVYDDTIAAVERMGTLYNLRSVDLVETTFIDNRSIAEVDVATLPIRRAYHVWQSTAGDFRKASHDQLSGLVPDIVMYRENRRSGGLVFSWVGLQSLSTQVHGRRWAANALNRQSGAPLGSEDRHYVERISSAYGKVWDTGVPHYSHVLTLLTPKDREPTWLSYQRLLTRQYLHDGRPALMCMSVQTKDISIPLASDSSAD